MPADGRPPGEPPASDEARAAVDLGSVADEAAKLLESLRRVDWGAAADVATAGTGREAPGEHPAGPDTGGEDVGGEDAVGGEHHAAHEHHTAHEHHAAHERPREHGDGPGAASRHVPMGAAETCTYCPVCRAVTVLRAVSPETLERLAELAGTAAALLADLAAARTPGRSPAAAGNGRDGEGRDARTPRTQSVPVVDEED